MPGFYNAGTWNATTIGNTVTWTFSDAAAVGRGDFTGTPNNCLEYSFCFNMTPLTNDPIGTNVDVLLFPDGFGAATSTGCCPTATNCGIPGNSSSTGPIGVSFNDPVLPVSLIRFDATAKNGYNLIHWTTAYETQAHHFEIESSYDNVSYEKLESILAKGESSESSDYFYKDYTSVNETTIYYRLKQIDNNGEVSFSKIITVTNNQKLTLKVYPNPANNSLFVESSVPYNQLALVDLLQKPILTFTKTNENNQFDISSIAPGVYFLIIHFDNTVVAQKLIVE